MADPVLSAAVNIMTVLHLIYRTIRRLKEYADSAVEVPRRVRPVLRCVRMLSVTLSNIEGIKTELGIPEDIEEAIRGLKELIDELEGLLPRVMKFPNDGRWDRIRKGIRSVRMERMLIEHVDEMNSSTIQLGAWIGSVELRRSVLGVLLLRWFTRKRWSGSEWNDFDLGQALRGESAALQNGLEPDQNQTTTSAHKRRRRSKKKPRQPIQLGSTRVAWEFKPYEPALAPHTPYFYADFNEVHGNQLSKRFGSYEYRGHLSEPEHKRAPCGCPATFTSLRSSGGFLACDESVFTDSEKVVSSTWYEPVISLGALRTVSLRWHSLIEDLSIEEGYSKYNRDNLTDHFVSLTPPDGTNTNELREFERAIIERRSAQIWPGLSPFTEEDDLERHGTTLAAERLAHFYQDSLQSILATMRTKVGAQMQSKHALPFTPPVLDSKSIIAEWVTRVRRRNKERRRQCHLDPNQLAPIQHGCSIRMALNHTRASWFLPCVSTPCISEIHRSDKPADLHELSWIDPKFRTAGFWRCSWNLHGLASHHRVALPRRYNVIGEQPHQLLYKDKDDFYSYYLMDHHSGRFSNHDRSSDTPVLDAKAIAELWIARCKARGMGSHDIMDQNSSKAGSMERNIGD